jgi:hypothetical protein
MSIVMTDMAIMLYAYMSKTELEETSLKAIILGFQVHAWRSANAFKNS